MQPSPHYTELVTSLAHCIDAGYRLVGVTGRAAHEWPLTPASVAEYITGNLGSGTIYLRDTDGMRVSLYVDACVIYDYVAPSDEHYDRLYETLEANAR